MMQCMTRWSIALAAVFLFVALPADAAVFRSGERVSVPEDAKVTEDFYSAGNAIHLSGPVEGDVYALGSDVVINGSVSGDVVVVGGSVTVNGSVGDDVRVVGGNVIVGGAVSGDVVAAGAKVNILSSSRVNGMLHVYGGEAVVEGEVVGAVQGVVDTLRIDGKVDSIDVRAEHALVLGDTASVVGAVNYTSINELSRGAQSTIGGTVSRKEPIVEEQAVPINLTFFFMTLFAALVSVLVARNFLTTLFRTEITHFALSGLVGLAVVTIVPFVVVVLCVVLLGLIVGTIVGGLYLALLCCALAIVPVCVGAFVAKLAIKEYTVSWLWTGVGVVCMHALFLIPLVGPLTLLVIFLVCVGMLARYFYSRIPSLL